MILATYFEPIEEETVKAEVQNTPKEKVKLSEILGNAPWLLVLASYFVVNLAQASVGSAGLFYFQYNLGNVALYSIFSFISIIASLIVFPMLSRLVAKFGSAKLIVIGNAIGAIFYMIRYITHDANNFILMGCSAIGTIGQILASSVVLLVVYDSFIYMKHKTGGKPVPEGVLVSAYSVAYKVGMALGAPLGGWLLATVPYVAGAATQEQSVLNVFFSLNTLVPALGFIVAMLFGLLLLKYDKQIREYKALDAAAKEQA